MKSKAWLLLLMLIVSVTARAESGESVPMLPPQTEPAKAAQPVSNPAAAVSKPEAQKSEAQASSSVISVTKVVGEVGEQFITSREVKINSAIEQVLTPPTPKSSGGPDDSNKILTGTERAFPGEVSRVLDEWAVYFEAKSLGSTSVNKAEIARIATQVQEHWAALGPWKDLDVGTEELKVIVERKLAASEFQKLKSDPALSPVSDDEALAYYKKNRLRFGSLPFSSFTENIKAYLVKSQVERRLAEWHEVLRRKYKTRNFISG